MEVPFIDIPLYIYIYIVHIIVKFFIFLIAIKKLVKIEIQFNENLFKKNIFIFQYLLLGLKTCRSLPVVINRSKDSLVILKFVS